MKPEPLLFGGVDELIERRAAEYLREIETMTDAALIGLGFDSKYVHRRRGQIRRFREIAKHSRGELRGW